MLDPSLGELVHLLYAGLRGPEHAGALGWLQTIRNVDSGPMGRPENVEAGAPAALIRLVEQEQMDRTLHAGGIQNKAALWNCSRLRDKGRDLVGLAESNVSLGLRWEGE